MELVSSFVDPPFSSGIQTGANRKHFRYEAGLRVHVIAIAGPTCAGKTRLALELSRELSCAVLFLDNYYRDLTPLTPAERARVNFDSPGALDHELLIQQVQVLSRGESVTRPCYDFTTHTRVPGGEILLASDFLIVEGLFALYWPQVRELASTRIFVNAPDDVCLGRRKTRDVAERGRTAESVTVQFRETVQPMATLYVRPTVTYADLVLSGEQPLSWSVNAVLEHVRRDPATRIATSRVAETGSLSLG